MKQEILESPISPEIKEEVLGSPASPDVKLEIQDSPASPSVKQELFESPASPDVRLEIQDSPASPSVKQELFESPASSNLGESAFNELAVPGPSGMGRGSLEPQGIIPRTAGREAAIPPRRYEQHAACPSPRLEVPFQGAWAPAPKRNLLMQERPAQQPMYQPLILPIGRPLREIRNRIQIQYAPNPMQDKPPLRTPHIPRDREEAAQLEADCNGRLGRRNALVQKTSHLHIGYFQCPTTGDWRCFECFRDMQEDWKFVFLHCVGLTVGLRTPFCPGRCGKNPFVLEKLYKCPACSLLFFTHLEEIERGHIFKHSA